MKIICASDLHLGYERTNYDNISKFLSIANHADRLILVGDTFDLWRYPVAKIGKSTLPGFNHCIDQLKELDVPTVIVPGNHDYNLKKVWKDINDWPNVNISRDFTNHFAVPEEYRINSVHFTHGWKFDIQQRKYAWAYSWLVTKFPYLYQKYMKKPARMGMGRNDNTNDQINAVHSEAIQYVKQNKLDYLVMGHTHVPGMFGPVIDCGDFVDSCSYVVFEDGKPRLEYI